MNTVCKLLFYKLDTITQSYILSNMYDVCIGTNCEDLGINNRTCLDLSLLTILANIEIDNKANSLVVEYEIPKILSSDKTDLIFNNFKLLSTNDKMYITKPLVVFIDNTFDYNSINSYIKEYRQYGVKEYDI